MYHGRVDTLCLIPATMCLLQIFILDYSFEQAILTCLMASLDISKTCQTQNVKDYYMMQTFTQVIPEECF